VFSPGTVANTDARTGYFDSNNGVFLKVTNGTASLVMRTSTSGSVVDTAVTQNKWNIDKFDGNGPSGQTLDLTKTNILYIQAQWLGVGRVQVGFIINGQIYVAHQFLNANNITVPYTQTFNLPVRLELRNTGTSVGATIQFNCCSVQSENGTSVEGFAFSAGNGVTTIGVTTRRPILSIRNKATFNSLTNRAHVDISNILLRATTNDSLYEVVFGGTLTGASWTSVNANSTVEFDVAATAISGGDTMLSGYAISGTGANALLSTGNPDFRQSLTLSQIDALTANQYPITIVATALAGTSNIAAALNWVESSV